jgi:D-serine deaminase-like pyridoxal phosphate-dependent protein
LQKGCPNCTQRGNLCAIPLKKVKFKVKNQEAINSIYKIIRRSSPNKALSILTTNSQPQSRETVPVNAGVVIVVRRLPAWLKKRKKNNTRCISDQAGHSYLSRVYLLKYFSHE